MGGHWSSYSQQWWIQNLILTSLSPIPNLAWFHLPKGQHRFLSQSCEYPFSIKSIFFKKSKIKIQGRLLSHKSWKKKPQTSKTHQPMEFEYQRQHALLPFCEVVARLIFKIKNKFILHVKKARCMSQGGSPEWVFQASGAAVLSLCWREPSLLWPWPTLPPPTPSVTWSSLILLPERLVSFAQPVNGGITNPHGICGEED